MNPTFLILGAVSVWYFSTAYTLLNFEFSPSGLEFPKIEDKKIKSVIKYKFLNKSMLDVDLQKIDFDIVLNGSLIGTIKENLNIEIFSNRSQIISMHFEIDSEDIGMEAWVSLIANNLKNSVIELDGTITADNKPFPYSSKFVIKDFVNGTIEVIK